MRLQDKLSAKSKEPWEANSETTSSLMQLQVSQDQDKQLKKETDDLRREVLRDTAEIEKLARTVDSYQEMTVNLDQDESEALGVLSLLEEQL